MYSPAQHRTEQNSALMYAKAKGWPVEPSSPTRFIAAIPNQQNDVLLTYPSVFDKILTNQEPCYPIYEDGACAAIVDKNPVAPLHIVIFPKDRSSGMSRLSNVDQRHVEILGHLIYIATGLARQFGCENGYRLVINDGILGGQSEPHICVHLLGQRQLLWPPG